ncbi:choice-of-anchor A family protein [Methylobacillus flagellatus]|uniref:choice-of-anchor A family protein n=1 Tax=Methylobacillus flagellatus TaxID=405 RepID=UPI002853DEB8|nr:choice-of-anchor A family protein [Methylobacillus flagellatus]MDR5172115.1 choice-of-anchor A family protein [Methylobacillus flagellatus]
MLIRAFVLPAIAATALFSASVHAALDANQTFQQFNAVVLGNIDSTSHLHGRAWVGGNVTGGEYVHRPLPASDYAGLTVQGNIANAKVLAQGAVINGNSANTNVDGGSTAILGNAANGYLNGPAYVAGTASNINFNGGQLATPNSQLNTNIAAASSTDFYSVLSNASDSLKSLDDNSSVAWTSQKATFTATADSTGLAVFNLSDADALAIFGLGEFDFILNGATTVVINSGLKDIDISANFLGGSAQQIASNVIWNFYNAETVDLGRQFGGSILAVDATLTNWADIEGNVYVNNLVQRGQIHQYAFTGDIPVTAVPEPSSYAMFLLGLGLLGFAARRRA